MDNNDSDNPSQSKNSPGPMGASEYKELAKQIAGRAKPLTEIEETECAGTVTQLQLEIAFDDKVKEMALFKDGEESKEDHLS